MFSRRNVVLGVSLVVVAVGLLISWRVWQVQGDLKRAESGVERLKVALQDGDTGAREGALRDLTDAAGDAAAHTDGVVWGVLSWAPFVGDDAEALRIVSRSLDQVSRGGIEPLAQAIDDLETISSQGRVDLAVVRDLQQPISNAAEVFASADTELDSVDSSQLVGQLRGSFETLQRQISEASSDLEGARRASQVLPSMLGGEGERDYLLIFQNNAEVRATGGLPGSWAQLHADDGRLELREQGSLRDFPRLDEPPVELAPSELQVYGDALGTFFADSGFTPDFPRAAELWEAHWDLKFPGIELDGVLSLDPLSLSYLLEGTGPVQVGDRTLTGANAVSELLSRPYLELDIDEQDAFFEEATQQIFEAVTGDLESPVRVVQALARAADERRFLVAPFVESDAVALQDSGVLGVLAQDDGARPHMDIGLNDATGSKMSYYLRYRTDVRARSCEADRQVLTGTMTIRQAIAPSEAAELPDSVTGGGLFGTEPGTQLVQVRLYGPFGGTLDEVMLDGEKIRLGRVPEIDGRPVATITVSLTSRDDLVLTWSATTGDGQTGAGLSQVTPSVVPGSGDRPFASAC